MYLNFRGISRIMAIFLMVFGVLMLPSAIVGMIYDEKDMVRIFCSIFWVLTSAGFVAYSVIAPSRVLVKIRDGFLIVVLGWLIAVFSSALPFYFSGYFPSLVDCIFESASGLTTTGATILSDIEILPKALLFWRCFTHWIGGYGILFIPIALLPSIGVEAHVIASAELSGPSLSKISPKLSDTARWIMLIYSTFTIIETILLMFGGLDLFDALTHSFSTMGTGGFSNYNASIAHFDSIYVYWVITVFMMLAGVNFNLYYLGMAHRFRGFFNDSELRVYLTVSGVSIALITIFLTVQSSLSNAGMSLTHAAFQVFSIMTTTGFCTLDYDTIWPLFPKFILLCLMVIGGCTSSTAGGIKCMRLLVCLKLLKRGFLLKLHPHAIIDVRINRKKITIDTAQAISSFVFLYFVILAIAAFVISLDGFDAVTSISTAFAALGNVGPGFNLIGPVLNYDIFSDPIKLFISLIMILGRLELVTFLMLFSPKFWNPNR